MKHTSLFVKNNFVLSDEELTSFDKLLSIFQDYNSHTNLSAIRDEEGIVEKHFIDSLYWAPIIHEYLWEIWIQDWSIRLLDIGSWWGFPGIPLKITLPELHITLLDSVWKKVKAMNHFISELWFTGIESIQSRAEDFAKLESQKKSYDFVVSRATAYITDILTWASPFLKNNGKILLYKMPSDEEEKDRKKIMKKLWLVLEAEFNYSLAGKDRVIYIFSKYK